MFTMLPVISKHSKGKWNSDSVKQAESPTVRPHFLTRLLIRPTTSSYNETGPNTPTATDSPNRRNPTDRTNDTIDDNF